MVDESAKEDFEAPRDEVISVPGIITDLVTDTAIPGIPAPVRRNLLKALGQLCSAAIDIPVAYLTGNADERRAETAARIQLINTSAVQIAQQMQVNPEYAQVAVRKFGHRVLREQVNLDLTSQRAASEIRDTSEDVNRPELNDTGETINDDWLNAFETEARQKSTEEMQAFFGKMLAGEIRRPGSYSTRTVKILGSFDRDIANQFLRLCSMSMSIFQDVRVPSMGGNAGNNALKQYGLTFDELNLLNEHGLIISDYNSWREFTPCVTFPGAEQQTVCLPFGYQGRHWILMPTSRAQLGKTLKIEGVALTHSGRELFRIVQVEPMDEYSAALAQFFKGKGFRMVEVPDGQPRVVDVNAIATSDS